MRRITHRVFGQRAWSSIVLGAAFIAGGCSDSTEGETNSKVAADGKLISEDDGSSSGPGLVGGGPGPAGGGGGSDGVTECAGVTQEAESINGLIDVIFVIDNSSSMTGEILQVENNINDDFAKIIEDSGLDYRVIMLARYGKVADQIGHSDNPICIRGPLGAGTCTDPNSEVLRHNPNKFFHHSTDGRSREALCDIIEAYTAPDELVEPGKKGNEKPWPRQFDWTSIAPNGFSEFLRPKAKKHFVIITDDHSDCNRQGIDFNDRRTAEGGEAVAAEFHKALLEMAPEQFGTAAAPRYVVHSIVGMSEKPVGADGVSPPWQPTEPIQEGQCPDGSIANGTGFQALSRLTGGLRSPSCRNDDFNAVFNEIANQAVNAALSCEWGMPPPPPGKALNPNEINLSYDPGGPEEAYYIPGLASAEACGAEGGWYYDDPSNPKTVKTCPSTCNLLKRDALGRIDIEVGCATYPPRMAK